ncbi:acyl-coenzyme A synthetase ACSM4, mitochondrial-like [Oculina patagonica]
MADRLMSDVVVRGTKHFQVPEYFNFADVIDEWAQKEKEGKRKSDHPALWWIDGNGNEVKWSFQDVAVNSKKTANVLCKAADIKPGDRVMVILPTIPEYWLMQTACLRTGGVLVPVAEYIGPKELHRRILKAKPVCVVAAPCDRVKDELLDVVDKITSSVHDDIRSKILVKRMKDEQREGWVSFEDLFQTASADYQSVKSLSSAPIAMFFTSGTTGNAKMVEHSQASMGLGGTEMRRFRFTETDIGWTAFSTGWSWLTKDGLCSAWSKGAGSFAHYKTVTPREALETLQKYPITKVEFTTDLYLKALDEEDLKSFKFPTLRCFYIGGEPLNKDVVRKWKEDTGVELWDCYGQTETNDLTFPRDPEDEIHFGSVGKAHPGVDLLVVDDNYQELPPGTVGKVVVRVKPYCPVGMFTRYVDDPESTAKCFSGDFYVTGDVGRKDEDGYFWIIGRTDDILFCDGRNINPYEVETCLKEHPAVLDCALVSSPHLMGQTAKAFVVLSSGFRNKNREQLVRELQDHVTYNTAAWMCPRKMEFLEDLPKTLAGKVNRRQLRKVEESTEFKTIGH